MKVNYDRVLDLSVNSITPNGNQLPCYFLIQRGLESYLQGETLTNEYVSFLIDMGVLEPENQEEKKIVKPFNFTGNDRPESN